MKKGRTFAVWRVPWVIAAAIFIFTAPTAPLLAQQITEIIDSTGDGTNGLDHPAGVAVDSADNVCVTGALTGSVVKITATRVVGTGTPDSCTEAALDAALDDGGLVTFDCGAEPVTITVTSTKEISNDTAIDGGSLITISGGNSVGVFSVNSGVTFTVQNLIIANGRAAEGAGILNNGTLSVTNGTFSGNSTSSRPGVGAAIRNSGTLTVTNCTFYGNRASGLSGDGGAISNSGTLTVTDSTFSDNHSVGQMWGSGGAISNSGTLTVTNSTFSGNSSDDGGGIDNYHGTLVVTNSSFSGNYAFLGGGISTYFDDSTLVVTNSTFSGNLAGDGGGGIFSSNSRSVIVSNSTFTDNSADRGGGIANTGFGAMTINNCTIVGNTATSGGGISNNICPPWGCEASGTLTVFNSTITSNSAEESGGGLYAPGAVTLTNTIIANNTGGGDPDDCAGNEELTDGGHNLLGDPDSACGLTNGVDDNIVGVDPLLDPAGLQDNGGPSETIALLPGSPAIDAGDPEVCANPPVNGVDQRGDVRLANCSIGAYEYHPPPCVGDCDGSGEVTPADLITLLGVALGTAPFDQCSDGEWVSDGEITVDEIVLAVNATPDVCPAFTPEQRCLASGGGVTTSMCCLSAGDFPDTCAIGACSCAPESSHEVRVCHCGENRCWDGRACVPRGGSAA